MRILRFRLTVFALWVVVCQSAALLAAPLAICCAPQTAETPADPSADCQCDGDNGLCPMHHKDKGPEQTKPARGATSCSGCADSSEMVFLTMTGPTAPIVAPFTLVTPLTGTATIVAASPSLAALDRPPTAPPPKA